MRYFLVLLPLLAAGCAGTYSDGYAYRGDEYYRNRYAAPIYNDGYAYGREYYAPHYAARDYGAYDGGYYGIAASGSYGGENCGTPDAPKGCPPLPRRPLQYYPGDRW